jgi:nucleoside phosphorylase
MKKSKVDVLVLTALPPELAALRAELGKPAEEGTTDQFGYVIWRSVNLKGRPRKGSVVAVIPIEKDQLPAANATHVALDQWTPRCFALIGIAGQLREKVKLGDVVVGRHCLQWDAKRKEESGADGKVSTQYSLTTIPSSGRGASLGNLLKSDPQRYEEWKSNCSKDRPAELPTKEPELHVEDIASGSATIDSEEMRQMLSSWSRHLYAVETEAAGAISAFHSRHPSALKIIIRGISDPASHKADSDKVGEGAWRTYSARNAAKLLVSILSAYPIGDRKRRTRIATILIASLLAFVLILWVIGKIVPRQPASPTAGMVEKQKLHEGFLFALRDHMNKAVPAQEFQLMLGGRSTNKLERFWINEVTAPTWGELFDKICTTHQSCLRCDPPAGQIKNRVRIEISGNVTEGKTSEGSVMYSCSK